MIEITHRIERQYRGTRRIEVEPIVHREVNGVEISREDELALMRSARTFEFHHDGTVVLDRDAAPESQRPPWIGSSLVK